MMKAAMKIGQLAQQAGINVQTIRYYERTGLLNPWSRSPSGYRLYTARDAQQLRFIKRAQTLGFTLREIQELLGLRVDGKYDCNNIRRKAEAKLTNVETKVRQLCALAKTLKSLIRTCAIRKPTEDCPILASLEEGMLSREGTMSGKRRYYDE